jgi:hypothetical protein
MGNATGRTQISRQNRRSPSPVAHRRPRDTDLARDRAVVEAGGEELFSGVELFCRAHDLKLCGTADRF